MSIKQAVLAGLLLLLTIRSATSEHYPINAVGLTTVARKLTDLTKVAANSWKPEAGKCPFEKNSSFFLWNTMDPFLLDLDDQLQSAEAFSQRILSTYRGNPDVGLDGENGVHDALDSLSFVNFYFKLLLLPMRENENDNLPLATAKPAAALVCKGKETLGNDCVSKQLSAAHEILPTNDRLREILNGIREKIQAIKCKTHQVADYFHALYTYIVVAELRGFALDVYSYYLRYRDALGNPSCQDPAVAATIPNTHLEGAYNQLHQTLQTYTRIFLDAWAALPPAGEAHDWCHVSPIRPNVNRFELEGLLEYVYISASDKSLDFDARNPRGSVSCANMPKRIKYPQSSIGTYPRPCAGRMTNCIRAEEREVCYSKHSDKRYEWTRPLNSNAEPRSCHGTIKELKSSGFGEFCRCTCVDNGIYSTTTHILNLQIVESDYINNMVITGLRMTVKNRVVHLQIKQGKISKNFLVEGGEWKPVVDIYKQVHAARLGKMPGMEYAVLQPGNKFQPSTEQLDAGSVLTGVKLVSKGSSTFSIQAIGRKYDPITGQLDSACMVLSSPSATTGSPLTINDVVVDNQPTMPFIQSIDTETKPPLAISGFTLQSLVKDGVQELGLQLTPYRYQDYVKNNLPGRRC